jgi:hypothetical protein
MIELCLYISTCEIQFWQILVIDFEMIYVELNWLELIDFQKAICNLNFIHMETLR